MDEELYRKIVHEAARVPNLMSFLPIGHGEPLMDPNIIDRIEYARKVIPEYTLIKLFTNGIALDESMIGRLKALKHVEITISINGIYDGTRQKVMGLAHDDTEHVLKMWKFARDQGVYVDATMVAHESVSKIEQQEFVLMGGSIIRLSNWAGETWDYVRCGPNYTVCDRALSFMYILWTGQVGLCCFDPFGKENFGNVGQTDLQELWNSDERQDICFKMQNGRREDLKLCDICVK
jgi:MoaA/NifB/PqqE/SkfB family radical SAM enzyme